MTAKRFTIKSSMIVDDVTVIIDNQKEYTFPVLDSTLNYMFCKVLNEQHETIQSLISDSEKYRKLSIQFDNRNKELVSENALLEKENEQLKQQLNYIQNSISEHIKHQKTELGQKALKEIIEDYNEWLLKDYR